MSEEILKCRIGRHLSKIPQDSMNELFILLVSWYLVIANHSPDLIKEVLLILLEVFIELELIYMNNSDNFSSAFYNLIRNFL